MLKVTESLVHSVLLDTIPRDEAIRAQPQEEQQAIVDRKMAFVRGCIKKQLEGMDVIGGLTSLDDATLAEIGADLVKGTLGLLKIATNM